jgi:septum formation protein
LYFEVPVMLVAKNEKRIILASASPRRREILAGIGVRFEVICADTDESSTLTDPEQLTRELARRKADAVADMLKARGEYEGAIIIAADTVVACDSQILGKPHGEEHARQMLSSLSGKAHSVVTGVAVAYGDTTRTASSTTTVTVDVIPPAEIEKYIASGEPFDKAGGYGIQGNFSKWISGIEGCYFGVVGLPVNVLSKLFKDTVGVYPDEV